MNFTFTLKPPPDKAWGTVQDNNKTWTGMVGLLASGQVDIGEAVV